MAAALPGAGIVAQVLPCDQALADTAALCAHYGYALDDAPITTSRGLWWFPDP